MGTTRSFCWLRNTGTEPVFLQKMLWPLQQQASQADERIRRMVASFVSPDRVRELEKDVPAGQRELLSRLFSPGGWSSGVPRLAYRQDAPWLPYFETHLCDGNIADSSSARKLSRQLDAPVLVLALYDSDILFASYGDSGSGAAWDYAKPNMPEIEEFDKEFYSTAFPSPLLDLFPAADPTSVGELWAREESFADDRMEALCGLLSLPPLYDGETAPEGFDFL